MHLSNCICLTITEVSFSRSTSNRSSVTKDSRWNTFSEDQFQTLFELKQLGRDIFRWVLFPVYSEACQSYVGCFTSFQNYLYVSPTAAAKLRICLAFLRFGQKMAWFWQLFRYHIYFDHEQKKSYPLHLRQQHVLKGERRRDRWFKEDGKTTTHIRQRRRRKEQDYYLCGSLYLEGINKSRISVLTGL